MIGAAARAPATGGQHPVSQVRDEVARAGVRRRPSLRRGGAPATFGFNGRPRRTGGSGELWTRVGHIKVKLNKGIDIRKLDRPIGAAVLGRLS